MIIILIVIIILIIIMIFIVIIQGKVLTGGPGTGFTITEDNLIIRSITSAFEGIYAYSNPRPSVLYTVDYARSLYCACGEFR